MKLILIELTIAVLLIGYIGINKDDIRQQVFASTQTNVTVSQVKNNVNQKYQKPLGDYILTLMAHNNGGCPQGKAWLQTQYVRYFDKPVDVSKAKYIEFKSRLKCQRLK